MSKSYECIVLKLYTGIFQDIRVGLPSVGQLERDENRLLFTVQTRGFRFLTVDMPAFSKHFDRCLADGRLTPSNITSFGCIGGGSPIPRFLSGLMKRVFERNGLLMSQPCITSIFFLRQLFNAAKKIKIDCSEKVRESTLNRYIEQERSCRPPSLNWHGGLLDHGSNHLLHLAADGTCQFPGEQYLLFEDAISRELCDTVHAIADRIASSFGYFNPEEWRFKHGPGAVADSVGSRFKYDFPTWSEQLERVFPYADFAFANHAEWADTLIHGKVATDKVVPSYVLTVPKSQKAPRIIAKEPTANMWCQQTLWNYLEESVKSSAIRSAISFRDQTNNSRGALEASRSGSHWTVDLSDASDRLSLWLVERLFRRNNRLLDAFCASRSVYSTVPTKGGDVLLRLKKYAPQGSATTFPLQTIVFAILAVSSVVYTRGWPVTAETIRKAAKEVQVFGDDSLVPSDCGKTYVDLLTYCGLSVNYSKTYGTGKFRESCGVEAYDGTDVTPAYITDPYSELKPASVGSTVECANNFYKKGLWHAAAVLESTLPYWVRKNLRIAGPGDGSFGLFSFTGSQSTANVRWNEGLQRWETLALSVNAKVTRAQPGGTGHLLQYFTENPSQDIHWMSGVDGRPSSRLTKKWEPTFSATGM